MLDEHSLVRLVRHLPVLRLLPVSPQVEEAKKKLRGALEGVDLRVRALALWELLAEDLACLSQIEREEGFDLTADLYRAMSALQQASAWVDSAGEEGIAEANQLLERLGEALGQEARYGPAVVALWGLLMMLVDEVEELSQAQNSLYN